MSLDLNKLENKLDEALSNETSETLNKFLDDKRMTNNNQSSVEWIIKQLIFKTEFENLPNQYVLMSDKNIDNIIEQAKEMEKEQIINAFWNGDNTDCTSEQNVKEFAEQYYNETYGEDDSLKINNGGHQI